MLGERFMGLIDLISLMMVFSFYVSFGVSI